MLENQFKVYRKAVVAFCKLYKLTAREIGDNYTLNCTCVEDWVKADKPMPAGDYAPKQGKWKIN